MQLQYYILHLILVYSTKSFVQTCCRDFSSYIKTGRHDITMNTGMNGKVVIVGASGGAAESLSLKLMDMGVETTTILDSRPCSPLLSESISKKLTKFYFGDVEKGLFSGPAMDRLVPFQEISDGKIVVVVGDEGDEALRKLLPMSDDDRKRSALIVNKVIKSLSPSVQGVVCALSLQLDSNSGPLGKLFGGSSSSSIQSWCEKNSKPFSILKFGKLIGGVPGREPLPFVGLPLLEPELNPIYTLQSVVLSVASNKYAADEICTRNTLSDVLARVVSRGSPVQAQVISIAGRKPLEKEWDQIFARVMTSSDVEVLRINFGAVLKLTAFTNWIIDTWFPQALIEADAATVLTGARPVRAIKKGDGVVRLVWEELAPDLTVRAAGEHEIRISADGSATPTLSVVRLSKGALPGEIQLMERLVEGVNKNAFKKQFALPLE